MIILKKCRVVIIGYEYPVKGIVIHEESSGKLCLMNSETCKSGLKHIAIVSDEDSVYIEDYYISVHSKSIRKSQYSRGHVKGGKVIASTDKSIGIPVLSNDIIEAILESYNAGSPIESIQVEYELDLKTANLLGIKKHHPKSTKGILNARLIKSNYNREEVVALLKELAKDCGEFENLMHHENGEYKELDSWINLKL